MRAVIAGLLIFVFTLVTGAVSIALARYYQNANLALIFPVAGVVCMFLGEKMLEQMELKMGQTAGGAGDMFFRSAISALIVWAVPALSFGVIIATSDLVLLGMEAVEFPRTLDDANYTLYKLTN